ncbi:MAG: hypothetical protein ACTHM7_14225 [Ginsengibacter sp.]
MARKKDSSTVPQIGVKNVPIDVAEKLQAIANIEGVSYNELYNLSFLKFIEAYENKNGKVKPRPKGKGLEGL